jgi:hypothetical protein
LGADHSVRLPAAAAHDRRHDDPEHVQCIRERQITLKDQRLSRSYEELCSTMFVRVRCSTVELSPKTFTSQYVALGSRFLRLAIGSATFPQRLAAPKHDRDAVRATSRAFQAAFQAGKCEVEFSSVRPSIHIGDSRVETLPFGQCSWYVLAVWRQLARPVRGRGTCLRVDERWSDWGPPAGCGRVHATGTPARR